MKRPDSSLVALTVGALGSAAANTAWTWEAGPVRVIAGLFTTALVPVAMHLWNQVPVTGRWTRFLRFVVMAYICGAAAVVNLAHAVMLLTDQRNERAEHIVLAVLSITAVEALMVMASLARRKAAVGVRVRVSDESARVGLSPVADHEDVADRQADRRTASPDQSVTVAVDEPRPPLEAPLELADQSGPVETTVHALSEVRTVYGLPFGAEAYVYRLFSAVDRLLYVGICDSPETRFGEHRNKKEWWSEVDRAEITAYGSRTEALAVEAAAIQTEKPVYNLNGGAAVDHVVRTRPHAADREWSGPLNTHEARMVHPELRLIGPPDELLGRVFALADRTGKRPTRNALMREFGVGATRAGRLLREFDLHDPSRPPATVNG